jgi:hypothetical protein
MKSRRRVVALRDLLDLCADLQRIRARLDSEELPRDLRTRLRRQVRTKSSRLAERLSDYRFQGPLGRLLRDYDLDSVHFQLLAALLQRHLRADEPALEGRRLLAAVFEDPVDILAGAALLQEGSALRSSGLIVLDDEDLSEDVLESRFRIAEDALLAFRQEIAGLVVEDRRTRPSAYSGNHEYLLDLRILHNLYRLRSHRLFHVDRWDRVHAAAPRSGERLQQRIDAFSQRIQRRLDATPESDRFPAVRFVREHGLDEAEVMMVIHLLFRELYEGNPYADAAELVRLVAASELDLVRCRRFVLDSGRLVTLEILENEPALESRPLTGEVHLSDWAVNFLFGANGADDSIDVDDRLDWHLYLKNLPDAQSFFRDLEAN